MADNKDKKVLNVPALRFPEFTGEWNFELLGIIAPNITSGKSKPSLGEYNLYGSTGVIGKTANADYFGDMLLVARVGANAGSLQLVNENCGITDNTLIIKPCKLSSHYLYFYLQHYNLNRLVFGSGQPLITAGMLKKVRIPFGNQLEQRKIERLLICIDERIATQNKIIEKLETLIKGITDVLLDNPLWEKVFLHSFMQFYPSNSLSWEQLSYEDGKIRNLHYGLIHNFSTKGINANSLPMILSHNEPKQYTLCKVGDVAFADASEDTNEIGKAVEFMSVHPSGTICGLHTLHGRDIKNKTVVGFKGFAFNSRYFHDQIKRLAQGSKVFSITANNLLSCYIYVPNIAKQEMITKLLHAYEEKIMANKALLDKYEMQRTYLQQRMFI